MNDRVVEAAAWRIWYSLQERGEVTGESLQANCGIYSDVFDATMDALMNIGQVEEVEHNDLTDECVYALAADKPRMAQVFPTVQNNEL